MKGPREITYFAYYEKDNPADGSYGEYLGFWMPDEVRQDLIKWAGAENPIVETFDNLGDAMKWFDER